MFEELVGEGEFAEPSSLAKILKVQTLTGSRGTDLAPAIARLEELALEGKSDEVLVELQNLLAASTASRDTPVLI